MRDYLFVTGKLAADALMPIIEKMGPDFKYEVAVLNISVAALMDTRWIARHLSDARGCDQVMIPGGCPGRSGHHRKAVRGPSHPRPQRPEGSACLFRS